MAKKESTGDLPKAVQDHMDKLKVSAEEYAQKMVHLVYSGTQSSSTR